MPLDEYEEVIDAYRQAVVKGILKVMGKMGISTLQSYKGAQIFEAIGLSKEVIDKCFDGTVSKVGGVDLDTIQLEDLRRHSSDGQMTKANLQQIFQPGRFPLEKRGREKGMESRNSLVTSIGCENK